MTAADTGRDDGQARWVIWVAGLLVACGAGVATAHGLYEVAAAAGAPTAIAWLYPLITDGLALVAYASTSRLTGSARNYAWTVVVIAAGLSGLAQASYLAGGVASAPPALRFGVGAWPAIAAAIVAHLLFLLGTDPNGHAARPIEAPSNVQPAGVQPAVQSEPEQPSNPPSVQPDGASEFEQPAGGPAGQPARERARAVARHHAHRLGELPTVRELMALAEVSRGTAGTALQELRDHPTTLHLVSRNAETSTRP